MGNEIKAERVLSSVAWRFAERICAQLVTFVVSIILARLLTPGEYGIIAITTVFITLCNVFVTSGFGVALIQKKDADELDFSTMLFFCFGCSLVLYGMLFAAAPFIADFYNEPVLCSVVRVMALRLPIAAINSVQQAYVARKMIFKKFFWATFIGTVVSAVVGIALAAWGYGVWALVAQYLVNVLIDTMVLGVVIQWRPLLRVSIRRFGSMFRFGWQIFCSDFLRTLYTQMRNLLIGKCYTADQLAYYNKGEQIPHLFVTNVGVAISSVLFPVMSAKQSDEERLRSTLRRAVGLGTYFMMPLMAGLAAVASPLTVLLLTEKWLGAVPFVQLACIEFCVEPWTNANLQALKAIGKSNTYLKMEFIKDAIAVVLLLASIPFGVYAVVFSGVVCALLGVLINSMVSGRVLKCGTIRQIRDVAPNAVISLVMFGVVSAIGMLRMSNVWTLAVQVIVGATVYVALSWITRNENFLYALKMIRRSIAVRRATEDNPGTNGVG